MKLYYAEGNFCFLTLSEAHKCLKGTGIKRVFHTFSRLRLWYGLIPQGARGQWVIL